MITSAANKKMKNISLLCGKAKERKKQGAFVVEGTKMFMEAPVSFLKEVYLSESFYKQIAARDEMKDIRNRVEELMHSDACFVEIVDNDVFKKVSDTMTPQGILCVVKTLEHSLEDILKKEKGLLLVLEDLQDPGNLGTILRAGEGAGITGVIMSDHTVDVYNPKTIRSTMGSIYRVPFVYVKDLEASIKKVKKEGYQTYAAHLKGKASYDKFSYDNKTAFFIGNEGNGLSDMIAELADHYVLIPMLGEVESLNAAIAATLLVYESARQRRTEISKD